jgi:carbon storage regulator
VLTLTRRQNESITIGHDIEVVVLDIARGRVKIGIRAPREVAVYRTELVATVERENRRALERQKPIAVQDTMTSPSDTFIHFPRSLFGLGGHHRFMLCDLAEGGPLRVLVSATDPTVQLYVVDALEVWPDFPLEDARRTAGVEEQEVAVAAVCTVPADGAPATVNLKAPIVIGLASRTGTQVILDREDLGMFHELVVVEPPRATGTAP